MKKQSEVPKFEKINECKLGHEIFKLIDYYINNYLTKKNLMSSPPMGINYDIFSKIVGKSCMVEFLRETMFGIDPNAQNKLKDNHGDTRVEQKQKAANIFK